VFRYVSKQFAFEPQAKCAVLPPQGLVGFGVCETLGGLVAGFVFLAEIAERLVMFE
jgi:hypothetical protein